MSRKRDANMGAFQRLLELLGRRALSTGQKAIYDPERCSEKTTEDDSGSSGRGTSQDQLFFVNCFGQSESFIITSH